MPITNMAFSPVGGLNDATYSPQTPASEAAIRSQIQGVSDQLRDYINNVQNPYYDSIYQSVSNITPIKQAIINGNFDIWQRGLSFSNPSGYTADRWKVGANTDGGTLPATIIHSQQLFTSGTLPYSNYFYRVNPSGAGSGFGANATYQVYQLVENGVRYLCGVNQKVTVSFYARTDIAGKKIGIDISQVYGTGGSPSAQENINGTNFSLTSTWTKYSFTFTTNTLTGKTFGTNNDDALKITFWYMWGATSATRVGASIAESFLGSGSIEIAQVQVNGGSNALPFSPKTFEQELLDCQRYYEKSYDYSIPPGSNSSVGSLYVQTAQTPALTGTRIRQTIPYKVCKRISSPTLSYWDEVGNANKVTTISTDTLVNNVTPTSTPMIVNGINSFQIVSVDGPIIFQYAIDAEL